MSIYMPYATLLTNPLRKLGDKMNPLSSKVRFSAQTRQTERRTNRTENQHVQTTKSDFGAKGSRMRIRYSALFDPARSFGQRIRN